MIYLVFPFSFVVLPLKSLSCCLSVLLSGCEKFIRLPETSECNGNESRGRNLTLYIMLLRPERKASPRVSISGSVNQHNEAWKITYEVVFLDILISLDNIEGEPESTVTQLSALSAESRNDNLNFLNWVFFVFDLCK